MKNTSFNDKKKGLGIFKSLSGFTLVEMIVVLSLVLILSTVVIVGYRAGEKQYRLEQAARQLVTDIRRAQNMAITIRNFQGIAYYGYGIMIDITQNNSGYIIYGDSNGSQSYTPLSQEDISRVSFPQKIVIQSISIQSTPPILSDKADIFFAPPNPTTILNKGVSNQEGKTVLVTIKNTDNASLTKTITVYPSGVVTSN